MTEEAKDAGADIAKFQTYSADKIAAEDSRAYWDLSEERTTSQRELFSKYDKLTSEDYEILVQYSQKLGIKFMSTPFDEESAGKIDPLVKRHKIASADITNVSLGNQFYCQQELRVKKRSKRLS
jgi:sialic acid synthase SpsE